MMNRLKICAKCKLEKSTKEFYPRRDRPHGLFSRCKACISQDSKNRRQNSTMKTSWNAKAKQWKMDNKAKVKQAQKIYQQKVWNGSDQSKLASLKSKLKCVYGLTLEQFEGLKVKQNHCCAICGKKTKLVVDHCHRTRRVRGLLCFNCNTGLGHLKDSIKILQKSIEYLSDANEEGPEQS